MKDEKKTKKELIAEVERLRWRTDALEKSKERLKRVQEQVEERTAELAEANVKLKRQTRERKQIEMVLSDSEERFRNLSEQSPNMIFINQGRDILYANRKCSDVMGYKREEFYHPDFDPLSLIAPESLDLIRSNFAKHQMGEEVPPYEYRLKTKGGDVLDVIITTRLIQYSGKSATLGIITDITDRKRSEEALIRAREEAAAATMARETIAGMVDGVVITDLKGRIIQFNRAWTEIFEHGEEVMGRLPVDFFLEEERSILFEGFRQVLKDGFVRDMEVELITRDGGTIPISINASLLKDVNGVLIGTIGVVRDITERKKAEEALLKSEARFRTLFTSSPDAIFVEDLDGVVLDVNPSACCLHGLPREQLIGKHILDLVPAEKREEVARLFPKLVSGEADRTEGFSYTTAGKSVPVEIRAKQIEYDGKRAMLLHVRDITEQKKAKKKLQESEELFRIFFENAPIYCYMVSPDGKLLNINKSALKTLGYKKEEIIGKSITTIYPPSSQKKAEKLFMNWKKTGELKGEELNIITKDGTEKSVLLNVQAVKDSKGKILHSISVQSDITERKQAEGKLRKTMEELRESNADLEQFAYAASHDLMAPLGTISGYVQLLAHRYKGRLDADADQYIERTVVGVENMQTLVEDILSFSRLVKQGRPEKHMDLNTILGQVLSNLNRTISDSRAVITNDELPTITADRSQLVQLFQNIIGNAVKFRGDDPPRVHVSAERKSDEWLFSISDNGIGIEPRFRKRIFILFQQLETEKTYPGTGMGLALCKKIVERHGGRIWVDSAPGGEGSTFYFTLPCES